MTTNSVGEPETLFRFVSFIWGEQLGLLKHEVDRMAGAVQGNEGKWRIRWRKDIQVGWEIEYRETRYRVISLEEIGRREGFYVIAGAI